MDFELWLEFEHVDPVPTDFANIHVKTSDREYALNVWTYEFLAAAWSEAFEESGPHRAYVVPPDLIVRELTRDHIGAVVDDLLTTHAMPSQCLVPDDVWADE